MGTPLSTSGLFNSNNVPGMGPAGQQQSQKAKPQPKSGAGIKVNKQVILEEEDDVSQSPQQFLM